MSADLIGAAIAAACSDPDVLDCLGGPFGNAARARAFDLRVMPEAERKRARALDAARARAPSALRGIHPSWIEAAVAGLPPRARADLALGADDAVSVWLARSASATLVPLPPVDVAEPRSIADTLRMSGDAFLEWLADVGADQLAFALGAAAGTVPSAARALSRIATPPRLGNLGARRAAITRATIDLDQEGALALIGARAIAPYTDAFVRGGLAQRLPRTRGAAILFELETWSREQLAASPGWDALAAARDP